jgi:hypothetical protein
MSDPCEEIMDCDESYDAIDIEEESHNRACDKADDYNDEKRLENLTKK